MRKKLTFTILITGLLVLTASFFLPSQVYAIPSIPHGLEGRDNCLQCHGQGKIKPFPADHKGRDNKSCVQCHKPKDEKASEKKSSVMEKISGMAGITVRGVDNERESAKFNEYRDLQDGVTGSVDLRYKEENGYFIDLKAKEIGLDDQNTSLKVGKYGKYKVEFVYDELPHRFAYDAKSLYAGEGSGDLRLNSSLRSDLAAGISEAERATILKNAFEDSAHEIDLELMRKTGKVNIDIAAFDPFSMRLELSREERDGTRPYFGAFGFHNTIEIPQPIDYDTSEIRFIAEYAKDALYLNASYYFSDFKNNIDTLRWDNHSETTDSTGNTAYINFSAGPAAGLIDLAPDNTYHQASFSGSYNDLPLKSRISVAASWGWMEQDDNLVAYATNTAITATSTPAAPFNASDPANLPKGSPDAKVDTTLYNVLFTSKPLKFMDVKARYRFYEYENKTAQIEFPGWVRTDALWEELGGGVDVITEPTSYKKHTASFDLGFDIFKRTRFNIGYAYNKTEREHREVHKQEEDTYRASIDSKPFSWGEFRVSYEFSKRDGSYDYTVPWERTIEAGDNPAQLPWLRKYDEAERDRNRIQLLATVYPTEKLSATGSYIFGYDDFDNSEFGLLKDKHNIFSIDANYAPHERLSLYAFYTYEKYENDMKSRQWTAGSTGDPFTTEPSTVSDSNWYNDNEDETNTFGGGFLLALLPKRLDLDVSYSYADTDGVAKFSSPVGTVDANDFTPVDYTEVDDTNLQTLHAKLKYKFKKKGLSATLGYMWERFDIEDYNKQGFTNVPTDSSGNFSDALLMGTLPENYEVNLVYANLQYKF
ncbi:MAG TPA: MtrB/PioB family decaheme-associated outer membrane protein [Nitrospinota bacterium]|nr:MtrB/PioB family decaheme-associated outer membrane protein [Nitrospinota bacterium]